MVGKIVVKSSWQAIGCQGNEAKMYRTSNGRFGTIPHVCSYEGVGEHGEVISNRLFLPRPEDIAKHHWLILHVSSTKPVVRAVLPKETDLRTLWITIFGIEGQSLVKAKSPRQLSNTLVHATLGGFTTMLQHILQLTRAPYRHWGRGPLETGRNMSGTLKGQNPFP